MRAREALEKTEERHGYKNSSKCTRESSQCYQTGPKLIPWRFSVYSGVEECLSRLKVGGLIGKAETGESNHSLTQQVGSSGGTKVKLPKQPHTTGTYYQNKSSKIQTTTNTPP